ncbi:FAD-dependent pyridine nucleotide-disulfide oxidoreductase [Methanolacinia petrolearia DSM 11571]|uniref:FAD-dependent pyridine nucleotide-disulfide oxidoreductase n=1 Tax=Methanolacinia petrolearia (strain DSM 11571 / OCM 486 / SEBR 4847) TaxID=679926 RepID=E1RFN8_METP4|nr:NAD(P)/FAD-dependent oxidoreductase [Methanolacinia petrolearia]ADN37342.1 FAD-dependent pyridine nucleotide-disulfide oxidoreductase [Methanolacinia petrolearia DSM 11571]
MITVIGGGPAGRLASIHLALGGREVVLIDKRKELGGQCLHKGCMVICALNDIARSLEDCRNLKELGVFDTVPATDYSLALKGMKKTQEKIAKVLDKETRDCGVDVVTGEVSVNGKEYTLDGEKTKPDSLIIATGSIPAIPRVEGIGLPGVYNPHTITEHGILPEKLAIIGGGVVAAEYGYIFSSLGVETEIISRSSFLRGKPGHLVKAAKKELESVNIRENSALKRITGEENVTGADIIQKGVKLHTEADMILIATGLSPNSGMISGIKKGSMGEITVNERMETDIPGVYAAGDVTGPPFLTPVARLEGIIAADNILGKKVRSIPACIPRSIKLRYEHSFFETDNENRTEISIPAPAGPGSFWYVHKSHTGRTMISTEAGKDNINGMYLGSPGSGPALAQMAYNISKSAETPDFSEYLEIHPSTDGIPYLIKYMNQLKESRQ